MIIKCHTLSRDTALSHSFYPTLVIHNQFFLAVTLGAL